MIKIPCLFQREFLGHDSFILHPDVTSGCGWVLAGEGVATRKWDGTACMIKAGVLHKRYDAKNGKKAPPGAIPCCDPDPVTGHHPHWVPVTPADKWHHEAFKGFLAPEDGTYELCGPHFQSNPEGFEADVFIPHGARTLEVERTFEGIRTFLTANRIEGIVFHHEDGRMCKIRRHDFGLEWGCKPARSR